jgi:tellurite resistance protein
MTWFESRSTREKKTTVKNLVAVMLADRKIRPEEEDFLARVCAQVGLSAEEFKSILDHPESVEFTPAEHRDERVMQLLDAVMMMMVDGEIDRREMDLCVTIAVRLGFPPSSVSTLVAMIVDGIKNGVERDRMKGHLEELLSKSP